MGILNRFFGVNPAIRQRDDPDPPFEKIVKKVEGLVNLFAVEMAKAFDQQK